MTRRRIVLELGETTTETHCGDCPSHNGRCDIFPLQFDYERCDECRAAEVKELNPNCMGVEDAE